MGNKIRKVRVENGETRPDTPIRRIFRRLHVKPTSWKSDSHLNDKQVARKERKTTGKMSKAKSSDWIDADLEVVPSNIINKEENAHTDSNSKNNKEIPTPPPRKHRKGSKDNGKLEQTVPKVPVVEELCVKKVISYKCPYCEKDEINHNHHHKHENVKKDAKRRTNLSITSLPSFSDLKLSLLNSNKRTKSCNSLLNEGKKNGKSYMKRARSLTSLLPVQLKKLRNSKVYADVESDDDSSGYLEDWDLKMLENYNPKDSSLPRARKLEKNDAVLADIESLIVQDADESVPKRPIRRNESLIKKDTKTVPETITKKETTVVTETVTKKSVDQIRKEISKSFDSNTEPAKNRNSLNDHSTLMKILQEFSIKDVQERNSQIFEGNLQENKTTPPKESLKNQCDTQTALEEKCIVNATENFINAEKKSMR